MSIPMAGAGSHTMAEPASSNAFRALMAGFPTGVAVVTTADNGGQKYGMTCTAVASVSASPPTLLVCLQHSSRTLPIVDRTRNFSVNMLHDQAQAVAELFASRGLKRFERVSWSSAPSDFGGPHLHDDTHAIADCRVTGSVAVADHTVIFGEVLQITLRESERPLVYGMREYWSLGKTGPTPAHNALPPAEKPERETSA